jgi:hypothetical protein
MNTNVYISSALCDIAVGMREVFVFLSRINETHGRGATDPHVLLHKMMHTILTYASMPGLC